MEENKFERQVQQKMDELKIHPSDAVWENIAARIEKKKRSNKGIFLLLLLFCVFLTAGYLLWNTDHHSTTKENYSETSKVEKSPAKISTENNKTLQPGNNATPGSVNQTGTIAGNPGAKEKGTKHLAQHDRLPVYKKLNPGEQSTTAFTKKKEGTNDISGKTQSTIINGQSQDSQTGSEKNNAQPEDTTVKKIKPAILPKPLLTEVANLKDTSKQPAKATATSAKKKKWNFGLLFSAGISGVGNDFLGLANSVPYDYLNAVGQVQVPPGSLTGATPSITRSGFGFIAGIVAERHISATLRLVTGINFKSFNTSNKVGSRNDTTGFYSARVTVSNYHNHYNFIEVPVMVKVQIGKGKNIPLSWEGGFMLSELVSSNALQFNSYSGSYYKDNSIFNKTQVGLNTSLSAELFPGKRNSFLIGPYFYYGASKLASEGFYNKKHFVFTGLRTQIIFGK